MSRSKTFKKNQEVFVVQNLGGHYKVTAEKVFRSEELGKGQYRVFMYSNTSSCYLSEDIFTDERQAEKEAIRRNKSE